MKKPLNIKSLPIILIFLSVLIFISQQKAKIHQINQNNAQQFTKTSSMWFIQVSQQKNCQQCQKHQIILQNSAQLLQGIVKFGKAPVQLAQMMAQNKFKIQKNPSYFFVGGDVQFIEQYKGNLQKASLTKFCLDEIQRVVKKRNKQLFGSSGASGQKDNSQNSKDKSQNSKSSSKSNKNSQKVKQLTDSQFQELILKGNDQAWFVKFYSPTCPHCVNLQPQWQKLPKMMKSKVNIAKVDATKHQKMAQKYQVKGFPTLLFFGKNDKSNPVPYNSERTAQAMSQWLQSQDIGQQKLQFLKLTQELYNKQCNRNIVCLIFLVQQKADKSLIKGFIQQVMQNTKSKPLRFFYANKLDSFEQNLMIQDRSYPKMVSVWDGINSYRVYNSGMNQNQLQKWIEKIMDKKAWIRFSDKAKKIIFSSQNQSQQL